jgi:hypothetical protein
MKRQKKNNLTDLEFDVCAFLMDHAGRENAVSRQELCDRFAHVDERTLRITIKHLVTKHGHPVGSCNKGYFWAITPKEIREVIEYYRSYGLSCLYVAARLKKVPLRLMLGQLTLSDLGGGPLP